MNKLDLRDYKILSELDSDSKTSYNQIGKKLKLSPSVVERRIKNLIKKGIILDFKSVINYKKLGWTYYSIYSRFQNINKEQKEAVIKYLKNHPLSGQVLLCDGRWQLVYGFFAKDIFQLTEELKKFNNLFGDFFSETEKIIHIGSHHYYRGYLLNKEIPRELEPYLGGQETTLKLDRELYNLLNLIRQDARMPIIKLIENMKLSIDQIRYKLKILNKEKILVGSWLHLNPTKLNLNFYRVLLKLKNLDERKEKEFLSFLNLNKNVIRANKVFGTWDYFIDLDIGTNEFRIFMDNFTKTFSEQIHEYETLTVYDEISYAFSPIF